MYVVEVERSAELFDDIHDGTSATILIMQVPAKHAVQWTDPDDYQVNLADLESLKELTQATGTPIGLFDASVHRLPPDVEPNILKALITPRGREVIRTRDIFGR